MGSVPMHELCIEDINQSDHRAAPPTTDFQRLSAALSKVAALVVENDIYLPIFERIEFELAALDAQSDAVSRARAIAARSQRAFA